MKNLILVVLAAAVGFGAAYYVVSQNSETKLSALRDQLAQAGSVKPAPAPAKDSPAEILQKLAALDPNAAASRPRAVRQIIFYLESLANDGNPAVQPISDFLATGQDMNYVLEERTPGGPSFWSWHPGQPVYSGLVLPPTLRLSLVDVLHYIGGPDAETALVAMLQASSRAVEVAYIGQLLEKLAPGKYTALADAMGKKLLAASASTNQTGLDAHSDAYLYAMLNAHGDTDAVAVAESKIKGPVDPDAAEYLLSTLKQQALPALEQAYNSASAADKNMIANLTYNYVGLSPEADQIFTDWVLNSTPPPGTQTIDARPRVMAIEMLCGGNFGPFATPAPTNPSQIAGRKALLNQLSSQTTDPTIQQAIAQGVQCLNSLTPSQ
jgi:hypothetical protein